MCGKLRYLNLRMFWELLKEHHVLEWSLTIIGAAVFIAGFINAAIAFRSSTITWAVICCIIGTGGLITFFAAGLELFFKVASTVILSYQNTLASEIANSSTADTGTMTANPEESRNILRTSTAVDHASSSNQQEWIECESTYPLQSKNQTKNLKENIAPECSTSVAAAEKFPLYETLPFEYHNTKEKPVIEDVIDIQKTNTYLDNDKLSTDSHSKTSIINPDCQKISPNKNPSLSLVNLSANERSKMNSDVSKTSKIISMNTKKVNAQFLEKCNQLLSRQDLKYKNFKEQKASKQSEIKVYDGMRSKDSVLCLEENGNHLTKALKRLNNSESKSLQINMLTPLNSPETISFKSKPLPPLPDLFNTAFRERSGEYYQRSLLALRTQQSTSSFEEPEVYY